MQGATRARRSLGMAASRDSTTTGRRPKAASSHHHTSHEQESGSRRCGCLAKRGQVTPFVCFVKRVFLVGGVARIDLRCTMPSDQRLERCGCEGVRVHNGTKMVEVAENGIGEPKDGPTSDLELFRRLTQEDPAAVSW